MACPNPSTLESFCIGGQLAQYCSNNDGTFPEIRVTARIVNPIGGYVCDPTNGAMLVGDIVYDSAQDGPIDPETGVAETRFPDGNDGCWCTCPLLPNVAADPEQALQPGGTFYAISVTVGGQLVGGQNYIVQLDADENYELESYACGQCIPLKDLLDPLPTLPPTASFCEAVENCLPPEIPWVGIEGPGITITPGDQIEGGDGHNPTIGIDEQYILGLVIDNCDEVLACLAMPTSPNGTVTIGGTVGAVTLDVDPDSICAIVNSLCPQSVTVLEGLDATGALAYTDEDGNVSTHQIWSLDPTNLISLDPTDNSLLLTLNVNDGAVGVSRPATSADVFLTDFNVTADAAYPAGLDINDGALVYKRADGKMVIVPNPENPVDVDSIVTNGNWATIVTTTDDGTQTTGQVIAGLLINDGAFGTSRAIDPNADVLLTEEQVTSGAGLDPATMDAVVKLDDGKLYVPSVTIPAFPEFVYVDLDDTVHADGSAMAGSGTTADPYQLPLSPTLCEQFGLIAAATGSALADDELLALAADGTCKRVTLPALPDAPVWAFAAYDETTMTDGGNPPGSGTTADPYLIPLPCCDVFEYADFDAATMTAGGLAGSGSDADPFLIPLPPAVPAVDLCALLGDYAAATGPAAATDELLAIAADGTCRRVTLPAGTTDTNTLFTIVDNDDSTFSLIDSNNANAGTIGLCELVDDLTSVAAAPTGAVYLYHDPATGACGLAPIAAAAAAPVFEYVTYDAATHDAGPVEGDGSAANPYQIPLPLTAVISQSVDYCDFDTAGTLPPRPVPCDGTLTEVTVLASTAPNGGDEVFEVFVNGTSIGTTTLASGSTSATLATTTAVTAGDVITYVMTSTTATAASTFGSISTTVECA